MYKPEKKYTKEIAIETLLSYFNAFENGDMEQDTVEENFWYIIENTNQEA
ncbi:hypothetical protein [Bacillus cereus]|nr:hypothetical protein [Bacillus cereus]